MRISTLGRAFSAAAALALVFVPLGAGQALPKPTAWRLESMELKVEIVPDPGRLRGEARLSLAAAGAGTEAIELVLNDELAVSSVTDASGRAVPFDRSGASLTIRPSGQARSLILCVRYEGAFTKRDRDVGFYQAWVGPGLAYGLTGAWYPEPAGGAGPFAGIDLLPRPARLGRRGRRPVGRRKRDARRPAVRFLRLEADGIFLRRRAVPVRPPPCGRHRHGGFPARRRARESPSSTWTTAPASSPSCASITAASATTASRWWRFPKTCWGRPAGAAGKDSSSFPRR